MMDLREVDPSLWLLVGLFGQALFFGRFLVQWIQSERQKRSVVPLAFWYLSLGGGFLLLAYALHIGDPVFILGQTVGAIVYIRNLALLRRNRSEPDLLERP
jgi:lipid-A-disaccharide synthase-like uncharacterized protein